MFDPGLVIPKMLKWYQWLPCLALSIIRQALVSQKKKKNSVFTGGPYGRLEFVLNM